MNKPIPKLPAHKTIGNQPTEKFMADWDMISGYASEQRDKILKSFSTYIESNPSATKSELILEIVKLISKNL